MIVSEKLKIIFISNPKTGTTFVQRCFTKANINAMQNRVQQSNQLSNKLIIVSEHITAANLKKKINKQWATYSKIVFIRSPYDKAVSSYFFYKNGMSHEHIQNYRKFYVRLNQLLVYLLPFSIWSLVKPIKKNSNYLFDKDKICVNYIGKTERLVHDLELLFRKFNIKYEIPKSKTNTSEHLDSQQYFNNKVFKILFDLKNRKEIKLYESVRKHSVLKNLEGLRIDEL